MDFVKALTFVSEDTRWKEKVAIGTALALFSPLIVPVILIMGYGVRLMQNVRDGKQFPLPEWDDWSGDLVRGFKLAVVALIWALPAILVTVPLTVGGIMADSDNGFAQTLGITIVVGTSCLSIAYAIFVTLMTPGFTIWFARDEQIRSGLQLSDIFAWTREHLIDVILFTIAYIVASFVITMVAGMVGFLLCLVGLIITVPLATFAIYFYQYNLLGQIAFKDRTGHPYYQPSAPPPAPPASTIPMPYAPPAATDAPAQRSTEPPAEPPASSEDSAQI